MLTLTELNALPEIIWSYSDPDTSVTLSDFQHGNGYVSWTIRYDFAPVDGTHLAPQTLHLRVSNVPGSGWTLFELDSPHGAADRSGLFPVGISDNVILRIRSLPGTFAGSAPTRRFVTAFYNQEI